MARFIVVLWHFSVSTSTPLSRQLSKAMPNGTKFCSGAKQKEGQDSFIVHDRSHIPLTKSIRRIGQSWGLSLAYFKEFSCPSLDYQTGFGSRIIPTKRKALALPAATSLVPLESIVVKKRDPEAEAAAKQAVEENREEGELQRMKRADDPQKAVMVHYEDHENLDPAPVGHQVENIDKFPEENKGLPQEGPEKGKMDVLEVDHDTALESLRVPVSTQIRFRGSGSSSAAQHVASGSIGFKSSKYKADRRG